MLQWPVRSEGCIQPHPVALEIGSFDCVMHLTKSLKSMSMPASQLHRRSQNRPWWMSLSTLEVRAMVTIIFRAGNVGSGRTTKATEGPRCYPGTYSGYFPVFRARWYSQSDEQKGVHDSSKDLQDFQGLFWPDHARSPVRHVLFNPSF